MNDYPAIISYGSRALLDYESTQKMSEESVLWMLSSFWHVIPLQL